MTVSMGGMEGRSECRRAQALMGQKPPWARNVLSWQLLPCSLWPVSERPQP